MKTLEMKIRLVNLVCCGLMLTVFLANAGERSNIRGMGMARTFAASARGLDAVGINPANLGLPEKGTIVVGILPVGFHIGSEFLNYDLYTRYFTGVDSDGGRVGRYLNESDKQAVLDAFKSDLAHSRVDCEMRLFGLEYRDESSGGIALTITDGASGFVNIPRDYADFFMNGNPPGSLYDFGATKIQASWTREYAMSFGAMIAKDSPVKVMTAGVAVKLVQGFGYYEIQRFDAQLNTADNGVLTGNVDFLSRTAGSTPFVDSYSLFPHASGSGLGMDFGIAGEFNDAVSFGVSVTDVGSMNWKERIRESSVDTTLVVDDPLQEEQRNAVENVLNGVKRDGQPFSTRLPMTLRVGLALSAQKLALLSGVPGELIMALDYNQGLVVTAASTTRPRVSFGMEYSPVAWLPLRSGVSWGGTDRLNVAMGLGVMLGAFELEFASENVGWLFEPQTFSYGSVAAGAKVRL